MHLGLVLKQLGEPISSFVSVNGPSTTVDSPPENVTRTPLNDGCSPSPASSRACADGKGT